ncbi:MAG: hypothetical protein RL660_1026 [Bacteroidota bacterium]|jgi:hypothetical protein
MKQILLCVAVFLLGYFNTQAQTRSNTRPKASAQEIYAAKVAASPVKDSTVVIEGVVMNCTQDPIPAIMVLLYDTSGQLLAQTLTDMMGHYSFTASRPSIFGLQIFFDVDSSQIVSGLIPNKDRLVKVDFIAKNLPERFLFPVIPSPSDMMMSEASKKKRNEMKVMLNGDASLIALTKQGKNIPTAASLMIGSVNLGANGIYYTVQDQTSIFYEQDGNIPPTNEMVVPIGTPENPVGNR